MNIKDIECPWEDWDASEQNNTVHVIPHADAVEHETIDTCSCQPFIDVVNDERGRPVGWIAVHSAWDGRQDSHEPPAP